MNKIEFQQKVDEGILLIEKNNFSGAVDVFDELNLESVKDVKILQNIAKAYEKCRRYDDAKEILMQAHECAPRSRGTLFHLCTIAVKGGDLGAAVRYYNDFCQIAKYDAERYVLQYRIAQAEGRDDSELIKILENFKGAEPDDRWLYELAKLYTTNNRINDALEVCDEITLWFCNGRYVQLAKELRAYLTGEPLTEREDQEEDETAFETEDRSAEPQKEAVPEETMPEQETFSDVMENAAESENNELTFVPDNEVFAGEEESPKEYSQHDIFAAGNELEIRESDEEEKLPEGEDSLEDAIREAFPTPEWFSAKEEEPEELDEEARKALEEARKAEEEAEAAREEAEEAEALRKAEEEAEQARLAREAEEAMRKAEAEAEEARKAEEAARLQERTEASLRPNEWAYMTFDEAVDDHVVFNVTGIAPKKEDEDVVFDENIFATGQDATGPIHENIQEELSETVENCMDSQLGEETLPAAKVSEEIILLPEETEAAEAKEASEETAEPEEKPLVEAAPVEPTEEESIAAENEVTEPEKAKAAETPTDSETEEPTEEAEDWKRPSEELDELEDLEAALERKQASSEKLGNLPIEPELNKSSWHFIVFGDNEAQTLERAQEILKEMTERVAGCPGRMLKTTAKRIENANIIDSLDHFLGSMVIVQNATGLSDAQLRDFSKVLEKDDNSLLIVFTDTEANFEAMFERVPALADSFTAAYEGHLVTARDLVDTAKEYLYYQKALMTRDAEGVCYEYARALLAEKKGFYRSEIRAFAGKALHYAEHNGLFGMFSGAIDEDGFLHITDKFFKKAGERK